MLHSAPSPEAPPEDSVRRAADLFQSAYRLQTMGMYAQAAALYRRSIEVRPTAEAHTYLGWTYRHEGKLDEAIAECKKAIALDAGMGNPYNDIGAYLIDREEFRAALPWLEQALACQRYASPHYAWYNLGRAYLALSEISLARACYRQALRAEPEYDLAREAIQRVQELVQARNRSVLP